MWDITEECWPVYSNTQQYKQQPEFATEPKWQLLSKKLALLELELGDLEISGPRMQ